MELDQAVRTFLSTKPDSGDPDAPIAQRRKAIHAGTDTLFAMFGRPVDRGAQRAGRRDRRDRRPDPAAGVSPERRGRPADPRLPARRRVLAGFHRRRRQPGDVPQTAAPAPAVWSSRSITGWRRSTPSRSRSRTATRVCGGPSTTPPRSAATRRTCRSAGCPRARRWPRRSPCWPATARARALRLQLLEVPPLDLTLDGMRASGVGDDFGITVDEMALCRDLYLPSPEDARQPARVTAFAPKTSRACRPPGS